MSERVFTKEEIEKLADPSEVTLPITLPGVLYFDGTAFETVPGALFFRDLSEHENHGVLYNGDSER